MYFFKHKHKGVRKKVVICINSKWIKQLHANKTIFKEQEKKEYLSSYEGRSSSKYKNNYRNERKKKTGHIKSKNPATKNTQLKSKITRKTYLQKSDKQLMHFTYTEIT